MAYKLNWLFLFNIPNNRRILRSNHFSYLFKTGILSRHFSSDLSTRYNDIKYNKIRKRLKIEPFYKMLFEEKTRVQVDLCHDNDERAEDFMKRLEKVFNHNTRRSKFISSILLLKAYSIYGYDINDSSWNQFDSNNLRSAITLAWCVEMFQAFGKILDDIVDKSEIRSGQLCWYKQPGVGNLAICDALTLHCGIYKLLEKNFSSFKCYMDLVHVFSKITYETMNSACIDLLTQMNQQSKIHMFTFRNFRIIAEYVTGSGWFKLPIFLAMHLAGGCSAEEFDFNGKLCWKFGLYFQTQDDYLDCFGEPEVTGNALGSDIRSGSCTWLSIKFLENASISRKEEFSAYYGVDDDKAVSKVIELYKEADLPRRFKEFEEQLITEIISSIEIMEESKGYLFFDLLLQLKDRER